MATAKFHIDPAKLRLCLQTGKYQAYSLSVGERVRAAAISIFEVEQKKSNEYRTSVRTPPKYISSFRVDFHRATLVTSVSNTDPGWATVEFGFHPGGNPSVYVAALKPLRRGLLLIAIL